MADLFTSDNNTDNVDLDSLYNDLVGEGKKFSDNKLLLKAKLDSDNYIKRLEQEQAELRADISARLSVEEALAKLQQTSSDDEQQSHERQASTMTPEMIQEIIDRELSKRTQQSTVERNQAKVLDALKSAWGDNYTSKLNARASELGLDKEFLTQLAQTKPDTFIKLVVPTTQQTYRNDHVPPTGRSGVTSNNEKTWQYYNKMRRENPKQYHSLETQREIYAQATKLGKSFYN
jgi:hypothetical protein